MPGRTSTGRFNDSGPGLTYANDTFESLLNEPTSGLESMNSQNENFDDEQTCVPLDPPTSKNFLPGPLLLKPRCHRKER